MFEDFRLKVFITVAKTGSFTKASKHLGISQPAVSQNISALEKETGATLISRNRGEATLTSQGVVFLEYAEKIQYWYSAAAGMFGEQGRINAGRPIKIAADPVLASYLLPETLSMLSGAMPELSIELTSISVHDKTTGEEGDVPGTHFGTPQDADVEISVSPSPETIDFEGESHLVGVMDAFVVASKHNRSVNSAAVSEEDDEQTAKPFSTIAGIPVYNRFAVWSGYRPFLTPDLEARTIIFSDSVEAVKSIVRDSVSVVGIVPAQAVKNELADGTLLQMPVRLPGFAFDVHFNPLPEFSGKQICVLLKETLSEKLKTI